MAEQDSVLLAQTLVQVSDEEAAHTFIQLRASKRLFETVHALNRMLKSEHRNLAIRALRRLGLEYGG